MKKIISLLMAITLWGSITLSPISVGASYQKSATEILSKKEVNIELPIEAENESVSGTLATLLA